MALRGAAMSTGTIRAIPLRFFPASRAAASNPGPTAAFDAGRPLARYTAGVSEEGVTDGGAADPSKDEWCGVRAGDVIAEKYVIVSLLGSGGFGAVFQAKHQTIGKLVAIKILRAELASDKH